MTDEQRLARLEKQAAGLRLISSGSGNLLGVPKFTREHDTIEDRLSHLQQWTKDFRLSGNGLKVHGSFNTGYCVKCNKATEEQGSGITPPPPPPRSCPDVETISVSFSGITLCSGCLDATPFAFGISINNVTDVGGINGAYTLTRFFTGDPEGYYFITPDNKISYDTWSSNNSCSGPSDFSYTEPVQITAYCGGEGVWTVWLQTASNSLALFYATAVPVGSPTPNENVCGTTVPDPIGGEATPDFCIGSGGTVTLSL